MTRARAPRVLVLYKRSTYERYGGPANQRVANLVARRDVTVARMLEAHESHHATISLTKAALTKLGAKGRFAHRYQPKHGDEWDLVVTLGGDGTLLLSSHLVGRNVPMVAINSSPETSVGFFCAGPGHDVEKILASALAGKLRSTKLTRMKVEIDGRVVHRRILNDVLFSHSCPAAATRYILAFRGVEEEQLSSGIWVGPAAGSTAAQRSAGGKILPAGSRKLQFVVREPYSGVGPASRLTLGLVAPGQALLIRSKIREGMLYMDGHDRTHAVDIGSEVRLSESDEPLTLLGLRR